MKPAKQHVHYAEVSLGQMYEKGEGVAQNYTEAVKWFRNAGETGGDASGQTSLAWMYYKGEGVAQDYVKAAKWYRKAAEQGDAQAQTDLGIMYENGQGVPKDSVQAYLWVSLAAAQNNQDAITNLSSLETSMTPEQIAESKRRASDWKSTHGTNP
jgi:TPR repeat protein